MPTAAADRGHGRVATWLLLVAAASLLMVGGVLTFDTSGGRAPSPSAAPAYGAAADSRAIPAPAAPNTGASPGITAAPKHRGRRVQRHPRRHPGPPRELRIHALGVVSPVVPIVAPDRRLVPPSDPQVLGWWSPGARPGVRQGSALITGHTVHTGGGALDRLGELPVGSLVEVRTPRLRMPYVVRQVRVYSKGRLSRDAERLFDQRVEGRLVIITCADWNGSEYLSNVVVTAVPQHGRRYLVQHPKRAERLAPNVLPIRDRPAGGQSTRG